MVKSVLSDRTDGKIKQNMIHQKAYFAILDGESISNARFRYDRDMDAYVRQHMWD